MTHAARVIDFVTVKRNAPMTGRSYGHWWLELDGEESYGWWPARAPLGLAGIIRGTSGTLNGIGVNASGSRTRDPNQGLLADHEFHPISVTARTNKEIREDIRLFASTFTGDWRWSVRPTMNCRLFQLELLGAAGLIDGTGNYHTRGDGCPALLPGRLLLTRITGRRRWPRNMPPPGPSIAISATTPRRR